MLGTNNTTAPNHYVELLTSLTVLDTWVGVDAGVDLEGGGGDPIYKSIT